MGNYCRKPTLAGTSALSTNFAKGKSKLLGELENDHGEDNLMGCAEQGAREEPPDYP